MLKTYALGILFTILGVLAFNYFFLSSPNNFSVSEGLWIESSRNLNVSYFSQEPFYFEKVPQKDLVIFSQLKDSGVQDKNYAKAYQMKRNKDDVSFQPIDLNPFYPCKLSGKIEKDKLLAKLQCNDKEGGGVETGLITFASAQASLFGSPTFKESSVDNEKDSEHQTLENIAKIERYNKEIYDLKVNLKNITETLKEGNLSVQMKKTLSAKYGNLIKENSNQKIQEKLKQLKSAFDEIELYRKAQLKISPYGSEVELASRINSIEWQRALKNWNVSLPSQAADPLNSEQKADQAGIGIPIEKPEGSAPPTQQTEEKGPANSWWKEF